MNLQEKNLPNPNDPEAILAWGVETFGDKITLSCSFSMEDLSLLHMLSKITKTPRVFALDTGRLNPETYDVAERVREKYGVEIDWYFPKADKVEALLKQKGSFSFRDSMENRKECCGIRKVEPINRALSGVDAWITGLRQGQSLTRTELPAIEEDTAHPGLIKLNPLTNWSLEQTREFVLANKIPYNALYDQGYLSIGCAPCTRAVKAGEHERAGRWWWENPEHKECGIHLGETAGDTK